jgi:ferritin-like metal-binding protein YciE
MSRHEIAHSRGRRLRRILTRWHVAFRQIRTGAAIQIPAVTRIPNRSSISGSIHAEPISIMPQITSPRELLIEELKDLFSAESQLTKALPRMAKAATSEQLREAFEKHLEETREQIARLEKIGKQLGESMKGKKCKAMEGLVAEGKEMMEEDMTPAIMDLALIGAAQKVEHYEISGYGTARTLAELVGETDVAEILQETLDEEGATDKLLTEIAMELNLEAAGEAGDEEEAEDSRKGRRQPARRASR